MMSKRTIRVVALLAAGALVVGSAATLVTILW